MNLASLRPAALALVAERRGETAARVCAGKAALASTVATGGSSH